MKRLEQAPGWVSPISPTLGVSIANATYEAPEKYKGRVSPDGKQLVGTRIDPKTELGKQLANLRLSWQCAAQVGERINRDDVDRVRQISEASVNVPMPTVDRGDLHWQMQRFNLIRKRITEIMDKAMAEHGRPPTSIGIPPETLDEVRAACKDFDVKFIAQT